MGAPALKPCGFHQLTMASLSFHDLLQCRALLKGAIGPLVGLPNVSLVLRNAAVRGSSIKHSNGAHAGPSRLHRVILFSHPRPVIVGVATPLVVHRLPIRPLTPNHVVIRVGDAGMHRSQNRLKVLCARLL